MNISVKRIDAMDISLHGGFLSTPIAEAHREIVSKVVASVEASEYRFKIIFTDGSNVECRGDLAGDNCLGVEYER